VSTWQSVPAASLGGTSLSLGGLVRDLRRRRRLLPLLREALTRQYLLDQAAQAGLSVASQELQAAADAFRRRRGLNTAAEANAWLAGQRLSILDLEDALEGDLLLGKLKDRVTADRLADHFAANGRGYDRASLRQIVVAREDLARELLAQVRDEGHDFAELARRHSRDGSSGAILSVRRRQLPAAVADQVFAAEPGELVGPVSTPLGFQLLLIEEIQPAALDGPTAALIREELFAGWVQERLRAAPMRLPLLEEPAAT
jgi:peptidylprolyl isomerase